MSKAKPVKVEYQTLVIIWFALLASQALFLLVIYLVKPHLFASGVPSSPVGEKPLVTLVFAAIAVVFLLLSFVLSSQHMRRAERDKDAGCVQTALVLGCILSEIPSILGLVLAFVFDHPYFYLWIAAGMLGVLLHFPRKGSLAAASHNEQKVAPD